MSVKIIEVNKMPTQRATLGFELDWVDGVGDFEHT